MATMKDIARIAGVSYGTVSNALNGRGNVSVEKMEIVLKVAKQIGYNLNSQAQLLRSSTSSKVAIILPHLIIEKYTVLFNAIRQTIESESETQFALFLTDDLPSKEIKVLHKIAASGYKYFITVSSLSDASIYYDTLKVSPDHVVFAFRKPKHAARYFGLDYKQAADAITSSLPDMELNVVGLYVGDSKYLDSEEFVREMRTSLLKRFSNLEILVHYSSDAEAYNTAFNFFSNDQHSDLVITQDIEKMRYITQAGFFGSSRPCPPIYTLTGNVPPMIAGIYCFPVNYAKLGQEVVNGLFSSDDVIQKADERVTNISNRIYTGRNNPAISSKESSSFLNLLTLPSPSTRALQKLLPNFFSQTGIHVNLSVRPFSEIYNILDNIEAHPFYDLLRVDVAFFPWFAEKILKPLNEVGDGVSDLLSKFTEQKQSRFSLVNATSYAMPFDASVQLLFYRKDLFEDAVIKRMYFELTGKELKVPQSFEEYDLISSFFYNNKIIGDSSRPYGSSATTGSAGIISSEYLLRYYAAGGRILRSGTVAALNVPLAERVLKEYIKQLSFVDRIDSEWWGESISRFEQGKLAMNIAYMNLFNDVAHSSMSNNIGFAPVPGRVPQIGGGVLGVSKTSQKGSQLEAFYRWLYSDVIQDHILMLGGNTLQRNFINMQEIRQRYPWLPLAYDEINTGVRESSDPTGLPFNLRLAEIIIGNGVINTIDGLISVADAVTSINTALASLKL